MKLLPASQSVLLTPRSVISEPAPRLPGTASLSWNRLGIWESALELLLPGVAP